MKAKSLLYYTKLYVNILKIISKIMTITIMKRSRNWKNWRDPVNLE